MPQTKLKPAGESLYRGGDVECSRCPARFTPVVSEVEEPRGVRVEFACPECKHVYTVAHIDKRGLVIRARITELGRQAPAAKMSAINQRIRTIRALKQELKRHVRR